MNHEELQGTKWCIRSILRKPGGVDGGRNLCRDPVRGTGNRFIVRTADLSANGNPTRYPDYFVNLHYRPCFSTTHFPNAPLIYKTWRYKGQATRFVSYPAVKLLRYFC